MEDTWFTRDLPVLEAIVALSEETPMVDADDIDVRTGFDSATVDRALQALKYADPPLLARMDGDMGRRISLIRGVTSHARRLVGQWPSPEVMAERIVTGLEERAENEPDEAKRGRLRRAVEGMTGAGREIAVDVMAEVVKKQMGV